MWHDSSLGLCVYMALSLSFPFLSPPPSDLGFTLVQIISFKDLHLNYICKGLHSKYAHILWLPVDIFYFGEVD